MKLRKPRSFADLIKDPRVESWSDERFGDSEGGDGIWLYLARPWWCPDSDLGCVHEWTVRDTIDSLNRCYEDPKRWDEEYGAE